MKLKLVKLVIVFSCLFYTNSKAQLHFIPQPTQLKIEKGYLDLSKGLNLAIEQSLALKNEKDLLLAYLKDNQLELNQHINAPQLKIVIAKNDTLTKEAYLLQINKAGILITATAKEGVFYALKTLQQVEIKDKKLPYLSIYDKPAFAWRGFLLDVGRNFQPIAMLKEQIEVMANYKLNVFHFHFTEDIAWRLESKKYPGLTAASNMTRWKGDYYTVDEIKDLIDYCKQRHILFLPEIDMPGHSAAFHRFFGVDMQSDSGMVYIKELLSEFKANFPMLDYLHIGGDEVKINNKNFMPEITKFVEQLGFKTTLGWSPGSNLTSQTIRQLWMGGPNEITAKDNTRFIDSKHLYLNHMDPEETVTTLFFRKIGEIGHETNNLMGATLCSWPDRAVQKPQDMFLQSAIYPGLLTFAERIWRGGGQSSWASNLPSQNTSHFKDFAAFENRLLFHKKKYFANKPFPYVAQQNLTWELIGPFDNEGDMSKGFEIEQNAFAKNIKVDKKITGATIILRHWWNSFIKGAIDTPKNNTTWYARTKIWSNKAMTKGFWIGFNDLSRSYASDSPDAGTWDYRQSKVWVNQQLVAPPVSVQAGMKGDLEKPMVDEGYSFRKPTLIALKKGWNTVLIKLPVKNFNGKNWQNPEKWMFTFTPID